MIVREVRLENIKSYGSPAEIVRLTRGVNAISGVNGAGKSTILEAVGCALFQHLQYRQEDFVREGETNGTVTIVVESRFDQRVYEVVRKVGRGAAHYVFDPDINQQVARGESEVGTWLKRHLQVDPEVDLRALFQDTVGPPQGTLTAAFLDAASERKSKFDRLLRVEEYLEAWRKLSALESAIDKERGQLEVKIARLEERTRGLADLESRRAELRDRQAEAGLALSRLLGELNLLNRLLIEFDDASKILQSSEIANERAAQQERHETERAARCRADLDASVAATRVIVENGQARDGWLAAENALRVLETRRRERETLQRQRNELGHDLDLKRHAHARLGDDITRCEHALVKIAELERRIPEQDTAEQRLADARLAKRGVDESRLAATAVEARLERARLRVRRGEAAVAAALDHQAIAAQLDERRQTLARETERLAQSNRSVGSIQELRQAVAGHQRQTETLRQTIAALDRQIAEATKHADPTLVVATLERMHHEATTVQAAAQSQLTHATRTRIQVTGGLCPFLHEECRNLREGVTLETYFDLEVSRWTTEVDRLNDDFAAVNQKLQLARVVEAGLVRATIKQDERERAAASVADAEHRLADSQTKLRAAAILANGRADAERDQRAASAAVLESERANTECARLPDLHREAREATEEREQIQRELSDLRERVASAEAVESELRNAETAARAIGHPREELVHFRADAVRLPGLREQQRDADGTLEHLGRALADLDRDLEPFADVDASIELRGHDRDRHRHGYELCLAAQAAAEELPNREAALHEAEASLSLSVDEHARAQTRADDARRGYDSAAHLSAQSKRKDVDQSIGRTQAELVAAEEEEERVNRELDAVRRLEVELKGLRHEVESVDEERQIGAALRTAIRATGPEITRQLLARISRVASRINADIMNLAGVELEWTIDYEIVTRRQGEARGFAQLSGGEQMAAALAVRLAAMRLLSNLRVAFLDEPTAHLDQARRSNLGDQVQRLQGFDQLVVISHDDTFDGLFGHVVRIGMENGRSRVLDHG